MNTREELLEFVAWNVFIEEHEGVGEPWHLRSEKYRAECRRRAARYLYYIEAASCVIVPRDPNDDMAMAGFVCYVEGGLGKDWGKIAQAVIAASPFAQDPKP